MLKKLFGSGARVKLLKQFLLNVEEEFFIRELTRILNEQINSLRRELENLEAMGMLKSREKNRKKYYRINPHFILLHELISIVRKTDNQNQVLLKKLLKIGDIDVCVLSGSFVQTESSIDIFVVGDIKLADIESFVKSEYKEATIRCGVMSREDFLYRITLKDKFIKTLFEDRKNLILKNKLKKDTGSFIF